MTEEMPRTNPNIMMTARLLLMPVFRSVELKVVDCASAGRVLRARTAEAVSSEGSREGTLVAIFFVSFISLILLLYCRQRLLRRTRGHNLTSAGSEDVCDTQNAMKSLLWVRDEQNTGLDEAHQTPRIEHAVAARNPRPVPRVAPDYLRRAARRTRTHQAGTPTRKFPVARPDGRRQNRDGRRADEPDIRRGTIVP